MEIYRIEDVSFTYPEQMQPALSSIDLSIRAGEWVTLVGSSGSGKTTLLKHLKPILAPHGTKQGQIYFQGQPVEELTHKQQASMIGFVMQNPDNQIVTDRVWHELAFGLENIGVQVETIRLKVAEMASFFGIESWFEQTVDQLSGGQKQLLNLAAIMVMQPAVLLLDEPTSQLDPIAANEFLNTLTKINEQLGTTIIMTEHRLEEVLPKSDRLLVLDGGRLHTDGSPRHVGHQLLTNEHPMGEAMSTAMRLVHRIERETTGVLTVKEGRQWLHHWINKRPVQMKDSSNDTDQYDSSDHPLIKCKEVWFRYERTGKDIVQNLTFDVMPGEILGLVGGNGAGKSTTLNLLCGNNIPYRGQIAYKGISLLNKSKKNRTEKPIRLLPQDPLTLFVHKTVREELYAGIKNEEQKINLADQYVEQLNLQKILHQHPYDLSGGEQQRVAIAKVLIHQPDVLLLDEPTKGLDRFHQQQLAEILLELNQKGLTIMIVSHDLEFCASYTDRCGLFFNGQLITIQPTSHFFQGNQFYTTAANRIAAELWPDAITLESVMKQCLAVE